MADVSRLTLFRDTALELGDRIELTATATGTASTFTSTDGMFWSDGGLNGREVWYASAQVASAANAQTRRLVTDTIMDTASIEVRPDWPAVPQIGDTVILVNSKGTGVTIPEIHQKFNQLIGRVRDEMAVEVAGTPSTFSYLTPSLAIPTTWDYVLGAQVEEDPNQVDDWTNFLGQAVQYQRWDRTATIRPQFRAIAQGKRVRLIGAISLSDLDDDGDTVPPQLRPWIAKCAAVELLEAAYKRTGDAATALTVGELLKTDIPGLLGRVSKNFQQVGTRIYVGASA